MGALVEVLVVAAVCCSGLVAGLFAGFGYAVMPGLRAVDDRAFVTSMQRINAAILNPVFLPMFLGGLVLGGVAAWLVWSAAAPGAWWAVAGAGLYLVVFLVTGAVNVPLNNELAAGGEDTAALRERFEGKWVRWNLVRAFAGVGSLLCWLISLVTGVLAS
ncbi:anthrone oxygenase family protein [Saccharopolyspora antimicrobica]|uniref:Membrane protein n=1 Tax=Saccharopolyspora antimicrobica TaxID=455193 RepID=A0ABX9TBQ6_9PSEU|nr:anthrone oxygenase family protein [Saccharopolyspora antimicrobica]RKT84359.1 putative membrane protein [Saccharopolyspora antimicrobica]